MFNNNNIVFMLLFTVASSLSITEVRSMSFGDTNLAESLFSAATSPRPISSRFLDLGGVISQLFSGFNQGTPGGSPGLNGPPNSQFYPGIPAQGANPQPSAGFGNNWPNVNQGMIQASNQIGGAQNQQLPQPSSVNFNSQTVQNQGPLSKQAQDLAQILNIQNNNGLQPNLNTGERMGNSRYQRSDSNQSPQGFTFKGDKYGAEGSTNGYEGTLDDFFKTENNNKDDKPFLGNGGVDPTTDKGAIWGNKVVIPTTTISNDRIVFIDDDETPYHKQCVQNCPTTSEYNPVCGSDGVTYFNTGRLVCARNCGLSVRRRYTGSCKPNSGR